MKNRKIRLLTLWVLLIANPAWAWLAEGHQIVAIIAADDLTPTARSHAAQILGVSDDKNSVEKGMAAADENAMAREN